MATHEKSRAIKKIEYEKLLRYLGGKFSNATHINRKFSYLRDMCIYSVMWNIGTRPKEAYGALISDVDIENKSFFISATRNKTKRSRGRKMSRPLIVILSKYLKVRKKLFPNNKYLFPTSSIKGISRRTLQINFQRALNDLGLLQVDFIDERGFPRYTLNLYSFRKGHATFLYEETGDPYIVKESLDHKNIETTIKFYIKVMPNKTQGRICEVFN